VTNSESNDPVLPVAAKMAEILTRRDEIRRMSEERVRQGLLPFPTADEVSLKQEGGFTQMNEVKPPVKTHVQDRT
jgi:hypothetical protein